MALAWLRWPASRPLAPAIVVERLLKRHWLALPLSIALLKSTFAWRALTRAGAGVRIPLEAEQIDAARHALRSLVSRDTAELDAAAAGGGGDRVAG